MAKGSSKPHRGQARPSATGCEGNLACLPADGAEGCLCLLGKAPTPGHQGTGSSQTAEALRGQVGEPLSHRPRPYLRGSYTTACTTASLLATCCSWAEPAASTSGRVFAAGPWRSVHGEHQGRPYRRQSLLARLARRASADARWRRCELLKSPNLRSLKKLRSGSSLARQLCTSHHVRLWPNALVLPRPEPASK